VQPILADKHRNPPLATSTFGSSASVVASAVTVAVTIAVTRRFVAINVRTMLRCRGACLKLSLLKFSMSMFGIKCVCI
jgi:hypothetical protein